MGYAGKLEQKLRTQSLRRKGLSYTEIRQYIPVSRDTLSRWCRDIPLTAKQEQRLLRNKIFGQRKGSLVAANNKRQRRYNETQKIHRLAKNDINHLSKRERLLVGASLYAGEGSKADGETGFANSDPKLIRFMMNWFKEFCDAPISRYRGVLWIHEGQNVVKAKRFWSAQTGIPLSQFRKSYIAQNKPDSNKIRKNIHKYGVFSIRFSCKADQRRIIGWISGLFDDTI